MRYDIAIKNCIIITMDSKLRVIKNGSLGVKDDRIAYIGNDGIRGEEEIDGKGKVVIPGLINCHTHSPMTLLRGIAEDLSLEKWLKDVIWPIEKKLKADHAYIGALVACIEMLLSGTTCFSDHYFFMKNIAEAVKTTGIRAVLAPAMVEMFDLKKGRALLREASSFIKEFKGAYGRITTRLGPHSEYSCSLEFLSMVRETANELGVGIHIHIAESAPHVRSFIADHGVTPIKALKSIGFLKRDVLLAHSIHLEDDDLKIISKSGACVAYNPVSNMKVSLGIPRVWEMINLGISVGIGTDGPASNNTLDMIREIRIGALLQKLKYSNPSVLPAWKALELATKEAAKALGLDNNIGSIEIGKKADLVLLNPAPTYMTSAKDLYSVIVYCLSGKDVSDVIVNGKLIVKNGIIQTIDIAKANSMFIKALEDLVED